MMNGLLDGALLAPIEEGRRLELNAAASWERVRSGVLAKFGWLPTLSPGVTAYRSLSQQESLFRQYYTIIPLKGRPSKVWNGQTWWQRPGFPQAATPGTSNHGWGNAVDVTGLGALGSTRQVQFLNVARAHGWDNNEGASISEPWHMVYKVANDRHLTGTTTPPAPLEEDDMAGEGPAILAAVQAMQATMQNVEQIVGVNGGGGIAAAVLNVGTEVKNTHADLLTSINEQRAGFIQVLQQVAASVPGGPATISDADAVKIAKAVVAEIAS